MCVLRYLLNYMFSQNKINLFLKKSVAVTKYLIEKNME